MDRAGLRVALDSSCIVPLLSGWHIFHAPTVDEYVALRRRHAQFVLPLHALLESFSVLTRLPEGRRFSAAETRRMLIESFSRDALIPDLHAESAWACIEALTLQGPSGGRIYDAVIAHSARRAGATLLLTWNLRDFLAVAPPGLEIRQPGGSPASGSPLH